MTTFSVEYDGEAVRQGVMDVRDLAPALLSLGKLCEETNATLNGDRAKVVVQVKANFKAGSFGITLDVLQNVLDQAITFITLTKVHDAKEILETIGVFGGAITTTVGASVGVYKGVIQAVKAISGRKVTRAIPGAEGVTQLSIEGNVTINVTNTVYKLYSQRSVQNDLAKIVGPLDRDGVDVLKFLENGEIKEEIEKDERRAFEVAAAPEAESVDESESVRVWQVRSASFDRALVWRFYEGDSTLTAQIVDERFWRQIEAGALSFKAGDLLRVRVVAKTTRVPGQKISTEYTITEVVEKIGEEPKLPFEPPQAAAG